MSVVPQYFKQCEENNLTFGRKELTFLKYKNVQDKCFHISSRNRLFKKR